MKDSITDFKAVVIGGSAGGVEALAVIISALPANFALPILVVQHLHQSDNGSFSAHIARMTHLPVSEPCDKERIECGHVYTAPANYHMLANRDWTISLSVDERVNWSRPSIDVLFESAAWAWEKSVIAILLSGANYDGTKGLSAIREAGGLTIAQSPASTEFPVMPRSAINAGVVDQVLSVADIARLLARLGVKEKRITDHSSRELRLSDRLMNEGGR